MALTPDAARRLARHVLDEDEPPPAGGIDALIGAVTGGRPFVGRYRVIGLLGRGGMGEVYRAEQDHPRRAVALKLIRPEFFAAEARRRFEHEARVLGRLQHPGIAQIFDAGEMETDEGRRPYFAMELVEGRPLVEFASEESLSTRQRLELFLKVCDAVEHAHRKGVVHRDLKPANILVAADGAGSESASAPGDDAGRCAAGEVQPKVLDFGVARVTDADVQVTTLQTDIGRLVGTLPYMSPEQATGSGDDLDTRSDVYALGVVLYELLSGALPYEVSKRSIPEAVRVIKEDEPRPLSSVNRVFRGDLETIAGKALEKERERRYQSVGALAGDIRRYLKDEPIEARPASAAYQIRKLLRRNRAIAAGGAIGLAALLSGVGVAFVYGISEARARHTAETIAQSERDMRSLAQRRLTEVETASQEAREAAAKAAAIQDYFREILLSAGPETAMGTDIGMRRVLELAAAHLDGDFEGEPAQRAVVESTLGEAMRRVGDRKGAEVLLEAALSTQRQYLGERHSETLLTMTNLGLLLLNTGRHREAEAMLRKVVQIRREIDGDDHRLTLSAKEALALVLQDMGDGRETESLFREVLEGRRRVLGELDDRTLKTAVNLGSLLRSRGRRSEAASLIRDSADKAAQALGDLHPTTLHAVGQLAMVMSEEGDVAGAVATMTENIRRRERVFGPTTSEVYRAKSNLGSIHLDAGELEAAAKWYREAADGREQLLGVENIETATSDSNLAVALSGLGRFEEAASRLERALRAQSALLGEESSRTLKTMNSLAETRRRMGDVEGGLSMSRRVVEVAESVCADNPRLLAQFRAIHGRCLTDAHRFEEAERELLYAREILGRPPSPPAMIRRTLTYLIWHYEKAERNGEADKFRTALQELDDEAKK